MAHSNEDIWTKVRSHSEINRSGWEVGELIGQIVGSSMLRFFEAVLVTDFYGKC